MIPNAVQIVQTSFSRYNRIIILAYTGHKPGIKAAALSLAVYIAG